MSWRQVKLVYFAIVTFSLSIAFGFALLGFWPILPFAGAELIGLGAALYLCARGGSLLERIVVDADTVAVQKGRRGPESSWRFQRAWTRVRLAAPRVAWYPSRLLLGSHGREIEIGGFLNEPERRALARALRDKIGAATRNAPVVPASGETNEFLRDQR